MDVMACRGERSVMKALLLARSWGGGLLGRERLPRNLIDGVRVWVARRRGVRRIVLE